MILLLAKYGHTQNMTITKNKPQYLVGKDYIRIVIVEDFSRDFV